MSIAKGLVVPVCLVVIWELTARTWASSSDTLVPPSDVVASIAELLTNGVLLTRTLQTIVSAGVGLCYGALLGLAGGLLLGVSPNAARLLNWPIELLRPMPSVALIPLSMMAFGFGVKMESAIVGFATFWPVLILAQSAIAGVDRRLLEVADVLQLGTAQRVFKIFLPAAAPRLIVALRLAIGLALVVAVTVEIVANPQGLGYGLVTSQTALKPADMLAYLFWVGLLGWLLNSALVAVQRHLLAGLGVGNALAKEAR
ncbi:Putative aliphatic sulfonates transport permease protein SsuC [Variovorax sp. PBS-H4]|nr:Putative aliphatic sulfonates transport permease protein SsuC [Variovorax sp. PBS-H4]